MRKIIIYNIYLYFILIMFGGIFTKLTIFNIKLLNIKSFLPDLILINIILISITYIVRNRMIKNKNKLLKIFVFYLTVIIMANLITCPDFLNILFILRDLYLPFLALLCLKEIDFTEIEIRQATYNICKICVLQIIFGFILAIIQRIMDYEWTSQFYTGYIFYGTDPLSGIKVWHANGVFRVPSVAGNSVQFAFYNLISFFFIKQSNIKFKKILIFLSFLNILLSTNKTVLIIIIINFIINYLKKMKKEKKIIMIFLSIFGIYVLFNLILWLNDSFFYSFKERLIIWEQLYKELNIVNLFFPVRLFQIGAGSIGNLSIVDNAYLYFLFSYGIIGFSLFVIYLGRELIKSIINKNEIYSSLLLALCYSAITTNIFQGRVYLTPLFLIIFLIQDRL